MRWAIEVITLPRGICGTVGDAMKEKEKVRPSSVRRKKSDEFKNNINTCATWRSVNVNLSFEFGNFISHSHFISHSYSWRRKKEPLNEVDFEAMVM